VILPAAVIFTLWVSDIFCEVQKVIFCGTQSDICPDGASDIFPYGKVVEEIENKDCFVALLLAMTTSPVIANEPKAKCGNLYEIALHTLVVTGRVGKWW